MKIYKIFLDDELLGTTLFENANLKEETVLGKIQDLQVTSGYSFLRRYCKHNHLKIRLEAEADKFISSGKLSNLKVFSPEGYEISCITNQIIGSDKDGFSISLQLFSSTLLKKEFPIHA